MTPLYLFPQLHSVSNLKPVIPSTVPDDFLEDDCSDQASKTSSAPANGAAAKKGTKRGGGRKQAEKKPKIAKLAAPAAPLVVSQPPPIGKPMLHEVR